MAQGKSFVILSEAKDLSYLRDACRICDVPRIPLGMPKLCMKRIFEKLVDVKSEEICALGLAFVFDLGGSNYAPPLAGIRLVLNLWLGRKQAVLAENAKVHRL